MQLNINTNGTVIFTNKLEKLKKSALPNAIRNTLNKAAFDVKQRTMPKTANETFVNRQPNFFKANSRVEMAKGFDINSMQSTVGFIETNLKGQNNFAVSDLEQQEQGGMIKKRAFIPIKTARSGGDSKPVRPINRLSVINKIVNSNLTPGKSKKQQFLNAVRKAGVGGYVIGNKQNKVLWRVESIGKRIRMRPLYSFKENRNVAIKGTSFMKTASLESGNRIEDLYIAEAKRQIQRLIK